MSRKSRLGIIIQARTGSSRLPNKMILPFFNGKGILELLIEKLSKQYKQTFPIILATTEEERDNIIQDIGQKYNIEIFRGSTNNVLNRFVEAAQKFQIHKIMRVCADNIFLDIDYLNNLIEIFSNNNCDYCSYALTNGTPVIKTSYGFWAEGVKTYILEEIQKNNPEPIYLEHVTNYIYSHPGKYSIILDTISEYISSKNYIRLTIDTKEDFQTAADIYSFFMENNLSLTIENLVTYIDKNEELKSRMLSQILNNPK